MKRIKSTWFLSVFLFAILFYFSGSLSNSINAQAESEAIDTPQKEYIADYKVNVNILKNGDINVDETIVHVKDTPHHGIYRDITYTFNSKYGIDYKTRIIIRKVEAYKLPEDKIDKKAGNYETIDQGDFLRVKIGSGDYEIRGPYKYKIDYTVKNVIRNREEFDEFFWNIIPHYWDMPINSATINITAPYGIQDSKCFIGAYGSDEECRLTIEGNIAHFSTPVSLNNEEGVTVALAFPAGSFHRLVGIRKMIDFLVFFCPLFLIIPVFITMHLIWLKFGKDEKPKAVYPHYEPPKNLDPLMGGYIYKQKIEPNYITALLIDLAIKGYIQIEKKEKKGIFSKDEFILHRTAKPLLEDNIANYIVILIKGIFGSTDNDTKLSVNLKDLKKSKFYEDVNRAKEEVRKDAEQLGYLDRTGNRLSKLSSVIMGISVPIGLVICTLIYSFASEALDSSPTGGFMIIFLVVSAAIVITYSFFMKKRSRRGTEIYGELLGLKMYIETAEIDKIKFHNDPEKYSGIYEALLPYAIVFGLEKKWAKKFEGLYTTPPDWYSSNDTGVFSSYVLAQSISDSFASSISSTYSPPSSSSGSGFGGFSGGGFSGGGGGGGGGGSW